MSHVYHNFPGDPMRSRLRLFSCPMQAWALVSMLAAIAPTRVAVAQASQDVTDASRLLGQYASDMDSVHVKLAALADAIPEDKYGWRPASGVRSVAEVFMHLAGEWYFYCPRSVGGNQPGDFGAPPAKLTALEKIGAKHEVIAEMQKSWAYCKAQLASANPANLTGKYKPWNMTLGDAAFGMVGDQHEHLGQLITYARSVGVKPPWSK